VLAANIDVALLVMGLDGDFNLRRQERYLVAAWQSGARPAIVLNKADLHEDVEGRLTASQASAPGVPVVALSAATGEGLDQLDQIAGAGETALLMGSSGTGKSTLLNRLLGEDRQRTNSVRESDSRGRHTTTDRGLFLLPSGWLLVDTPGIRELQLWADEDAVDRAFADIDDLARECRFRDCRHQGEPGCAVASAVESGDLDEARLGSFNKLQREIAYTNRRQDQSAALAEKRRWKAIHKAHRKLYKHS
jgi:ribosome biogenesis GTPase